MGTYHLLFNEQWIIEKSVRKTNEILASNENESTITRNLLYKYRSSKRKVYSCEYEIKNPERSQII